MNVSEVRTPAFIVDLDKLERNIESYQTLCNQHGVKLMPMIKTHKSSDIAKLQLQKGADGFLVGTLDEAIKLAQLGSVTITLAYPFIGDASLKIIDQLADEVNLIVSLDSLVVAKMYDDYFKVKNKTLRYLLLINSGLDRFGVEPDQAGNLVDTINKNYKQLQFIGIATHPGQVYKEKSYEGVLNVAKMSQHAMASAVKSLRHNAIEPKFIITGSTPTFDSDITSGIYNVVRPGNYVFYDVIQTALGIVDESDCSLTIRTTVLSQPNSNRYVLDCGSKCLGLDKGAHGNSAIKGYGRIVGHTELTIDSLSEEVCVISAHAKTSLKIGDQLEIIPNHSCSAANMTSFLIGVRNEKVEKIIEIDMRGNQSKPNIGLT